MNTKICTSIEQSKKLIELGIDINTADMCYPMDAFASDYDEEPVCHSCGGIGLACPAWSLSALLDIIPSYIGRFEDGIDFGLSKSANGKWYSAHYLQTLEDGLLSSVKVITSSITVDAAFEMICWLKENKKI